MTRKRRIGQARFSSLVGYQAEGGIPRGFCSLGTSELYRLIVRFFICRVEFVDVMSPCFLVVKSVLLGSSWKSTHYFLGVGLFTPLFTPVHQRKPRRNDKKQRAILPPDHRKGKKKQDLLTLISRPHLSTWVPLSNLEKPRQRIIRPGAVLLLLRVRAGDPQPQRPRLLPRRPRRVLVAQTRVHQREVVVFEGEGEALEGVEGFGVAVVCSVGALVPI